MTRCTIDHKLTWAEYRARYHPDARRRDHPYQREADVSGVPVRIIHPTHGWVLEQFDPEC